MKAVGNGKEIKLNKDKSCLNYSGKAFNQEGVRILEAFFFFFFSRYNRPCVFFLLHQTSFSLSVYLFIQGIADESSLTQSLKMELFTYAIWERVQILKYFG